MSKKQTAIDFLLSHIPDIGKDMIGRDIIREAKELEKQNLIDARVQLDIDSNKLFSEHAILQSVKRAEKYYNNTFN